MRNRIVRVAAALAASLALQGGGAFAQYSYPGGFGTFGWGGWGGGGGATPQGDMARGLGAFAAGAGQYNQQTAVANSINTDTVMRWNQYMYESRLTSARNERERMAERQYGNIKAQDQILKRLRDNPEQRDIDSGSALNVAADEINNPKVYSKALQGAKEKIGGPTIRNIPFQHAADAITTSFHALTQGPPPEALMRPEFAEDRAAMKEVGPQIRKEFREEGKADPELINRALQVIAAAEAKADRVLPKNSRDRVAADRYLKSLHGLLAMAQTPALDVLLSGVEKRPDVSLSDLLSFMNSFNLRFGRATTPEQRAAYAMLYPKLRALRDQIAPLLAESSPSTAKPAAAGEAAGEFFSGMQYEDLRKQAPAPNVPSGPK